MGSNRFAAPLILLACGGLVGSACSATANAPDGGSAIGGLSGAGGAGSAGVGGAAGGAGSAGGGGGAGAGSAGVTGGGGGAGSANAAGGVGGLQGTGGCSFAVASSTSTAIPTVGIVSWSTSLPAPTEAHIDFGLTTSYGMTAPVNLANPAYRTLLLGMKSSRLYHFRVEASDGANQCTSQDYLITTGTLASGLPAVTPTTYNASALFGGFLLAGEGQPGVNSYILDADGDPVWWFSGARGASGVQMSYDGNYMWINSVNYPDRGAFVHRVSMDGLSDEDLSSQFVGQDHQLTVLPDETVAFYAAGTNSCDDIKERSPDGTVTTVVNSLVAHGGTGTCHINNVQYSPWDDTLVFSDLLHQDITKVTRTGATVWVLNGTGNTFTGDSWQGGQHGIDILGLDDFVIFSNNSAMGGGTATGSSAIEMKLDLATMTSTQIWSYTASPGIQNDVMGDVQRLPNGNTVVAYSTQGVVEEVDAAANLLQKWTWPTNNAVLGYIAKRATLYGPPPR
jgi:hypothetical protein